MRGKVNDISHIHEIIIIEQLLQCAAHYNMIRQATFNTHAPKLFFKSITIIFTADN